MQENINDKMLEKNKHEITIFVNGEEKIVKKEKISYEEVIKLAFGHYEENDSITYTVVYFKGNSDKPNGFRTLTFFLQINSLKVLKSRLIFLSNIFSFFLVVSCCLWYNIKKL